MTQLGVKVRKVRQLLAEQKTLTFSEIFFEKPQHSYKISSGKNSKKLLVIIWEVTLI